MRTIEIKKQKMILKDEIENIIEGKIRKIGTGAMIIIPKKYLDKEAYVLIKKD